MEYIDELLKDCEKPQTKFVMKDITKLKDIKQAVYIIEQIYGDIDKTFLEFARERKRCASKKYPPLNAPSKTMYVGSIVSGLSKRIKEHTTKCSPSTSALRLNEWFYHDYRIIVLVYDNIIPQGNLPPKEAKRKVKEIEAVIWNKLDPAFGRRGGR